MQLSGFHMTASSVRAVGFVAVGLMLGLALNEHYSVSAQPTPPPFARGFYLTTSEHNGANALTACTRGFHMASLWEVFDPTNLAYDTTLGTTDQDSGSGPPSDISVGFEPAPRPETARAPGMRIAMHGRRALLVTLARPSGCSEEWDIALVGTIQPWQGIEISCDQTERSGAWKIVDTQPPGCSA